MGEGRMWNGRLKDPRSSSGLQSNSTGPAFRILPSSSPEAGAGPRLVRWAPEPGMARMRLSPGRVQMSLRRQGRDGRLPA
jgi:hypothetical protein